MRYADWLMDHLADEGYDTCFFVAGGNIMHLLEAARTRFTCVPVVHEVAAGIAVEYFNEVRTAPGHDGGKAFALVTAGPGLTNILTAMAGAFLESRELLVVGGQVKSTDLARGRLRQRGIQEIDGVSLARPVCKAVLGIETPVPWNVVARVIADGSRDRKGPVFIEVCLDAQGAHWVGPTPSEVSAGVDVADLAVAQASEVDAVRDVVLAADRPVVLIGGGVQRAAAIDLVAALADVGVPMATTWNAADRVDYGHPLYFGRPNTWGMRWSNMLVQQADALIVLGSRLGLQQTGFNWQEFAPKGRVVQVDIDPAETQKGHPHTDMAINCDANDFGSRLATALLDHEDLPAARNRWADWVGFGQMVKSLLPLSEESNRARRGFINPYDFVLDLADRLGSDDCVVPCSSGGAFTVMMQAFRQQSGQVVISDKGLASMGYGLSGALGAALAHRRGRVVLVEGDGGFAQHMQELGTIAAQQASVKIFLFDNGGYASIRMTQHNYFHGAYLGVDAASGLGLPDWVRLSAAFGIDCVRLDPANPWDKRATQLLESTGPALFVVPIDPEQTYYPKIVSRITAGGSMRSDPLHLMSPQLSEVDSREVLRFLDSGSSDE